MQGIWSGGRSKQIDQPTGPTPVPSPIGRGVISAIPLSISELVVTARREVRERTRKFPIKDESWKIKKDKTEYPLASILAYEGIPFKSKSV